jgi:DNA mismatch repair protein MLH1
MKLEDLFAPPMEPVVHREVELTSVLGMRQEVDDQMNPDVKELFRAMEIVGFVGLRGILVSVGSRLFVISLFNLLRDFFSQQFLELLRNFPTMKTDINMKELSPDGTQNVADVFQSHGQMLSEYFSISMKNNRIVGMPVVIKGWTPTFAAMRLFLEDLVRRVDWSDEVVCFSGLIDLLASLYSVLPQEEENLDVMKTKQPEITSIFGVLKEAFKPSLAFRDTAIAVVPFDWG